MQPDRAAAADGGDPQPVEEEEYDDFSAAWDNLDTARLIYSQQEQIPYVALAQVHERLGDLGQMNEDYQQAAGDYYTTLECYQKAKEK